MAGNTLKELRTKEREERKDLIIDAAERVFSTRPFNSVGMRDIAQEAGIGTSSIYTYFPNQEALFLEAITRDSTSLIDEMGGIAGDDTRPEEALERVIEVFLDFISHHDSYFRMMVLFMTHGNLKAESISRLNTLVRKGFDLLEGILQRMNYAGDTRMLSHLFFASLNGILVTFRKFPGRTEEEIITHMKKVASAFKELTIQGGPQ